MMNIKNIANKRHELLSEYKRLSTSEPLTGDEMRDAFQDFIENEETLNVNDSNIENAD